jgi:hypothetical protein
VRLKEDLAADVLTLPKPLGKIVVSIHGSHASIDEAVPKPSSSCVVDSQIF